MASGSSGLRPHPASSGPGGKHSELVISVRQESQLSFYFLKQSVVLNSRPSSPILLSANITPAGLQLETDALESILEAGCGIQPAAGFCPSMLLFSGVMQE